MKTKIIQILLIIFSINIFYGCEKDSVGIAYQYEVTGSSGSYSVTLQNADDNTQQWSNVGNNWWYRWNQKGKRWLYISAQNNNSYGDVTVRIYKAGKIVSENTSFGAYTIATVSGDY